MIIEKMFVDDINRKINGVVKVDQDENFVLVQELEEYVITRELKKHFITFFENYGESFRENISDVGVWISGFFGSGKSHFLKMLSYLLENKEVQGVKTVERFRKKFEDDAATFALIEKATQGKTDTILFNIDIQGFSEKDKTAVLRVFAKMFYNYLGFYGEDLKIAKLEQFIEKQGKTEEFRRVFEEKNGASWVESRDTFAFLEDDIVETLREVLGMSESSAKNWFNGNEKIEISIAKLVAEIKEYVDAQPENFRLLFMVDEVGQYVGDDTNLLLNLQSLVESLGSECHGKVWVVCTGQEAIDEVIKARENEFSRIQARFKTRLSLSSSSADEVIQKRILKKTPEAKSELENVYAQNDSVLRNLFSFTGAVGYIRGYDSADEFSRNFPFVPYQFILMQKVFAEIRKHGNSGKHLSGGERSMLSGFQEVAQKLKDKDENSLAPFYLFYNTVHTFLDSSIRQVIERAEQQARADKGLKIQDVEILKLLYLVRYVDDVKATSDNLVILMADKISLDKISMREKVGASLERLLKENYIGRAGDVYNFLTDEEQDIQKEIKNTVVDTSKIVSEIGKIIFDDVYTAKKYRYGLDYDFPLEKTVDNILVNVGQSDGLKLKFFTVAADVLDKSALGLMRESAGTALVVLADTPYYECMENAMKIEKYVTQKKNITQQPQSVQNIIKGHQEEARKYRATAKDEIKNAIDNAEFYVDGEHLTALNGDAKKKIDRALECLVAHVYSELGLIRENATGEKDIFTILKGEDNPLFDIRANSEAVAKVEEYLTIQSANNIRISMANIQSRYKKNPYGWKELDIACVVARLIYEQKVTVKYGGATIQPTDPKLPNMLHKKSETGNAIISKRKIVSERKIREVRSFLNDYFDKMDVPEDEDGLIRYIVEKFDGEKAHYKNLLAQYTDHKYPDKNLLVSAVTAMENILAQQKDNTALIDFVLKKQDELFDLREDLQNVEAFFSNQKSLFDKAQKYERDLQKDSYYLDENEAAKNALNAIRIITRIPNDGKFNYSRLPELHDLMATIKAEHNAMLEVKRQELFKMADDCLAEIRDKAKDDMKAQVILRKAEEAFAHRKKLIAEKIFLLTDLSAQIVQIGTDKDKALSAIKDLHKTPPAPVTPSATTKKKKITPIHRMAIFSARTLETENDVDEYFDGLKKRLKDLLKTCDGIRLE